MNAIAGTVDALSELLEVASMLRSGRRLTPVEAAERIERLVTDGTVTDERASLRVEVARPVHPDTDRLNWLNDKARQQQEGTADAIAKYMERGATLRQAIDSARGRPVQQIDASARTFDVVAEYHRLVVREWEKAYERPIPVPLPNDAEKTALIELEKLIRGAGS